MQPQAPKSKIVTIDIEKRLERAARLNALSGGVNGAVEMEIFREQIRERIRADEHIHLKARGIIECINPNGKCWNGPREVQGND